MVLKRKLGFLDIFCIATGAMISSGIFVLPGLAHLKAGPAVVVSYFFAGLLALPGMFSIIEMTTAMPKAGGDCFTIIRSLGPAIGTVAGLLSWFSLSMKSAFALLGISIFASDIIYINIQFIALFFCVLFLIINLIGIKEAGITQVVLVLSLIGLMLFYIIKGLPEVKLTLIDPFVPKGINSIFTTAGFVFVAYGGLLKVASVAEEIKNPQKNIFKGMMVSLVITIILYTFIVFITTGVLDSHVLDNSLTPISDGAEAFLGIYGRIALSIAAILAFLSTANAGIMTAARSLVPLSRDNLLPEFASKINKRFQTPHNALFITCIFIMITLFLNLEILVKAASAVLILTNILSCFSVIIIRESKLTNYKPTFKTPFYPWIQIIGIIGLVLILWEIGNEAFLISVLLIVVGFLFYIFYGRKRSQKEFAFKYLIERVLNKKITKGVLEKELKDILRERDDITPDRFDNLIEESIIIDIKKPIDHSDFFKIAADRLSEKLNVNKNKIFKLIIERERESSTVISNGIAIPHIIIDGKQKFEILIARSKEGIVFSKNDPYIHAVFMLIGTVDERNFHLKVLSYIAQIIQDPLFLKKWLDAKNTENLRDIIHLGQRKR